MKKPLAPFSHNESNFLQHRYRYMYSRFRSESVLIFECIILGTWKSMMQICRSPNKWNLVRHCFPNTWQPLPPWRRIRTAWRRWWRTWWEGKSGRSPPASRSRRRSGGRRPCAGSGGSWNKQRGWWRSELMPQHISMDWVEIVSMWLSYTCVRLCARGKGEVSHVLKMHNEHLYKCV